MINTLYSPPSVDTWIVAVSRSSETEHRPVPNVSTALIHVDDKRTVDGHVARVRVSPDAQQWGVGIVADRAKRDLPPARAVAERPDMITYTYKARSRIVVETANPGLYVFATRHILPAFLTSGIQIGGSLQSAQRIRRSSVTSPSLVVHHDASHAHEVLDGPSFTRTHMRPHGPRTERERRRSRSCSCVHKDKETGRAPTVLGV